MRMPPCQTAEEEGVICETAAVIVGKDARLSESGGPGAALEISLADRPTSRLQAQLLAAWLAAQIGCLSGRGRAGQTMLLHGAIPLTDFEELHAVVSGGSTDGLQAGKEMAGRLMSLWPPAGEPLLFLDVAEMAVEGISLPNDRRCHRSMLQVVGTAAAAVAHQVAMHCRERGQLLAEVWNLQLGLLDLELIQTRDRDRHLAEENRQLRESLAEASRKATRASELEREVERLQVFENDAQMMIRALRREVEDEQKEVQRIIQKDVEMSEAISSDLSNLRFELDKARNEAGEAERQRDVALTALYSVLDSCQAAKLQVMEMVGKEEERLREEEDLSKDAWEWSCSQTLPGLKAVSRKLNQTSNIELLVESELSMDAAPESKHMADVSQAVMNAKHAGKHLAESLRHGDAAVGGDGGEDGAAAGGDGGPVAGGSPRKGGPKLDTRKSVQRALSRRNKTIERVMQEHAGGGHEALLAADMTDVEDMQRQEMWEEIQKLRQREGTLVTALQSLEAKIASGGDVTTGSSRSGEPAPGTGAAESAAASATAKSLSSQAAPSVFMTSLLRAVVKSKEQEAKDRSNLAMRKQRMKAKALGQAKARKSGLAKVVEDSVGEQKQAVSHTEIALMRMQYRELWNLCKASSMDPAIPEQCGLPPPPEFGKYFEAHLSEAKRNTQDGTKAEGEADSRSPGAAPVQGSPSPAEKRAGIRPQHPRQEGRQPGGAKGLKRAGKTMRSLNKVAEFTKVIRHRSGSRAQRRLSEAESSLGPTPEPSSGPVRQPAVERLVVGQASASPSPTSPSKQEKTPRLVRLAGAIAQPRFKVKDQSLREALYKFQDTPPRSPEWAVKVVEAVYKLAALQEAKGKADHNESVPNLLISHFASQYGAKSLVQEYASATVATLRKFHPTHIQLDVFQQFLSEEWSYPVLSMFLEAVRLCETPESMTVPCVEYPIDTKQKAKNHICLRKAVAVAEHLLGRRPSECVAGFTLRIQRLSERADPQEVATYYSPGSTSYGLDDEEARRGPFRKMKLYAFLRSLCVEAERLRVAVKEAAPKLFREWDTDYDGLLRREDIEAMMTRIARQGHGQELDSKDQAEALWKSCVRIEEIEAAHAETTPSAEAIGLKAFQEAATRDPVVSQYLKMLYAPPPPPEMDEASQDLQEKMLYVLAERNWKEYSNFVFTIIDDLGDMLGAEESNLRGMIAKMENEPHGGSKLRLLVSIIKLLVETKVQHLLSLCNPNPQANSNLETELESMERALKVMYGWSSLIEDDYKKFYLMLDGATPLVLRRKAGRLWNKCAKVFSEYKKHIEAHAANLLKIEFAALWLKKHMRRSTSGRSLKAAQRHLDSATLGNAAKVLGAKPEPSEEEKALARLPSHMCPSDMTEDNSTPGDLQDSKQI
uniref:EF-hand domain-containing protein n=2 Tax=Tetraselmis sp. GSL018 TaxID=582737 RepID=A0A061QUS2_9CHLO